VKTRLGFQVVGRNSRNPASGWDQKRSIVSACCSNRIAVTALLALPMEQRQQPL
jgi:hypothetical protein